MSALKKGCLYSIVTVFTVIAVGAAVLWFIHRPLHKPSFLVRLTVDMKVNGEPVHIDRILRCKTFVGLGGGLERAFKRRETAYAVDVGALGKRLSDGSAVMMWTPYYCERRKDPQSGQLVPVGLPPDRLPFIGWMPNADVVNDLEIYPSPAYFEKPYARIRDVRVRIDPAPKNGQPDPPDEFEWFTTNGLKDEGRPEKYSVLLMGYNILTLAETQWRRTSPYVDSVLSSITQPTIFGPRTTDDSKGKKTDIDSQRIYSAIRRIFLKSFESLPDIFQQRFLAWGDRYIRRIKRSSTLPLFDIPTISNSRPVKIGKTKVSINDIGDESYIILKEIYYIENNMTKNRDVMWNNILLKSVRCIGCLYLYNPHNKTLFRIIGVGFKIRPRESLIHRLVRSEK